MSTPAWRVNSAEKWSCVRDKLSCTLNLMWRQQVTGREISYGVAQGQDQDSELILRPPTGGHMCVSQCLACQIRHH